MERQSTSKLFRIVIAVVAFFALCTSAILFASCNSDKAHDHTYDEIASTTNATCDQPGFVTYKDGCKVVVSLATGEHRFENGVCVDCGQPETAQEGLTLAALRDSIKVELEALQSNMLTADQLATLTPDAQLKFTELAKSVSGLQSKLAGMLENNENNVAGIHSMLESVMTEVGAVKKLAGAVADPADDEPAEPNTLAGYVAAIYANLNTLSAKVGELETALEGVISRSDLGLEEGQDLLTAIKDLLEEYHGEAGGTSHTHSFTKSETLSTKGDCDTVGIDVYECECGETYVLYDLTTGTHDWALDETAEDYVEPDCVTPGCLTYKCTNEGCEATESVNVRPTGHVYDWTHAKEEWLAAHPATPEPGPEAASDLEEEAEEPEHYYAATCITPERIEAWCPACGEYTGAWTEAGQPTGEHHYVASTADDGCDAPEGFTVYHCETCGGAYVAEGGATGEGKVHQHNYYINLDTRKALTDEEKKEILTKAFGEDLSKVTEQQKNEALESNLNIVYTSPEACIAPSLIVVECATCGDRYAYSQGYAKGHHWVLLDTSVYEDPCTLGVLTWNNREGFDLYHCENCGYFMLISKTATEKTLYMKHVNEDKVKEDEYLDITNTSDSDGGDFSDAEWKLSDSYVTMANTQKPFRFVHTGAADHDKGAIDAMVKEIAAIYVGAPHGHTFVYSYDAEKGLDPDDYKVEVIKGDCDTLSVYFYVCAECGVIDKSKIHGDKLSETTDPRLPTFIDGSNDEEDAKKLVRTVTGNYVYLLEDPVGFYPDGWLRKGNDYNPERKEAYDLLKYINTNIYKNAAEISAAMTGNKGAEFAKQFADYYDDIVGLLGAKSDDLTMLTADSTSTWPERAYNSATWAGGADETGRLATPTNEKGETTAPGHLNKWNLYFYHNIAGFTFVEGHDWIENKEGRTCVESDKLTFLYKGWKAGDSWDPFGTGVKKFSEQFVAADIDAPSEAKDATVFYKITGTSTYTVEWVKYKFNDDGEIVAAAATDPDSSTFTFKAYEPLLKFLTTKAWSDAVSVIDKDFVAQADRYGIYNWCKNDTCPMKGELGGDSSHIVGEVPNTYGFVAADPHTNAVYVFQKGSSGALVSTDLEGEVIFSTEPWAEGDEEDFHNLHFLQSIYEIYAANANDPKLHDYDDGLAKLKLTYDQLHFFNDEGRITCRTQEKCTVCGKVLTSGQHTPPKSADEDSLDWQNCQHGSRCVICHDYAEYTPLADHNLRSIADIFASESVADRDILQPAVRWYLANVVDWRAEGETFTTVEEYLEALEHDCFHAGKMHWVCVGCVEAAWNQEVNHIGTWRKAGTAEGSGWVEATINDTWKADGFDAEHPLYDATKIGATVTFTDPKGNFVVFDLADADHTFKLDWDGEDKALALELLGAKDGDFKDDAALKAALLAKAKATLVGSDELKDITIKDDDRITVTFKTTKTICIAQTYDVDYCWICALKHDAPRERVFVGTQPEKNDETDTDGFIETDDQGHYAINNTPIGHLYAPQINYWDSTIYGMSENGLNLPTICLRCGETNQRYYEIPAALSENKDWTSSLYGRLAYDKDDGGVEEAHVRQNEIQLALGEGDESLHIKGGQKNIQTLRDCDTNPVVIGKVRNDGDAHIGYKDDAKGKTVSMETGELKTSDGSLFANDGTLAAGYYFFQKAPKKGGTDATKDDPKFAAYTYAGAIETGGQIIIDLNGNTLRLTTAGANITLSIKHEVTIKNGTLEIMSSTGSDKYAVGVKEENASLTLENVTLVASDLGIDLDSNCNFTATNCEIHAIGTTAIKSETGYTGKVSLNDTEVYAYGLTAGGSASDFDPKTMVDFTTAKMEKVVTTIDWNAGSFSMQKGLVYTASIGVDVKGGTVRLTNVDIQIGMLISYTDVTEKTFRNVYVDTAKATGDGRLIGLQVLKGAVYVTNSKITDEKDDSVKLGAGVTLILAGEDVAKVDETLVTYAYAKSVTNATPFGDPKLNINGKDVSYPAAVTP